MPSLRRVLVREGLREERPPLEVSPLPPVLAFGYSSERAVLWLFLAAGMLRLQVYGDLCSLWLQLQELCKVAAMQPGLLLQEQRGLLLQEQRCGCLPRGGAGAGPRTGFLLSARDPAPRHHVQISIGLMNHLFSLSWARVVVEAAVEICY